MKKFRITNTNLEWEIYTKNWRKAQNSVHEEKKERKKPNLYRRLLE